MIVALLIANRALSGLEIERRSSAVTPNYESRMLIICEFAVSDLHFATVYMYGLRTDLGGCKISKFSGGRMPPDPPISFCTSRGSSYKRSVPAVR